MAWATCRVDGERSLLAIACHHALVGVPSGVHPGSPNSCPSVGGVASTGLGKPTEHDENGFL